MKARVAVIGVLFLKIGIAQIQQGPVQKSLQQEKVLEESATLTITENIKLKPENIKFNSGRTGWKLQIPGNRPLATVAYEDGLIFVGGGYGSYEFYAIDAQTGNIAWIFRTGDDGPTAAVVRNGYVVFNTESCTIYVLRTKTGKQVWEKWLGDPLMSQPAIDDENVYMAYPGGDGSHHLVAMKLKDGTVVWDVKIKGDLISAPILHQGSVYLTTFDGTVYRYNIGDGKLLWAKEKKATSAPTIYEDRVFVSLRQEKKVSKDTTKQFEGLATLRNKDGVQEQKEIWARREAQYLVYGRKGAKTGVQAELDASVGFGSLPASGKLEQAKENVGVYSVVGSWAYQGSRPVVKNGYSYNAMGDEVQSLDIRTGKRIWSEKFETKEEGIGGRVFTPPSYANGKLFIGSGNGEVFCINAKDGKQLWKEKVQGSISFQLAVAEGMVFVSTDNGILYGIKTNDLRNDGWYMWGGNSEHNK